MQLEVFLGPRGNAVGDFLGSSKTMRSEVSCEFQRNAVGGFL